MGSPGETQKLYYFIGEVAELLGENASLIRFWEQEFGQLHSRKNSKGERLFTTGDIEKIRHIHFLVKKQGLTLDGARNALRSKKKEIAANFAVVKSLEEVRDFLEQIKSQLEK